MTNDLRLASLNALSSPATAELVTAAVAGDLTAVARLRQLALTAPPTLAVSPQAVATPLTARQSATARTFTAPGQTAPSVMLNRAHTLAAPSVGIAETYGGARISPGRPGSGLQLRAPARPSSPRSTDVTMPSEIGHMDYFPHATAVSAQRAPRWIDRAPVYVDSKGTATLTVASGDIVAALLVGSGGLALPLTLFSGSGPLKAAIRGKRLTSLKARSTVLFQNNAVSDAGDPPDLYVAEQLETILSRLVVTIYADASNAYAMRPLPMRSLRDGFIFPDGTEPFCDDDDFRVEVAAPTGLPSFDAASATLVSAEVYVEAVFE